MPLIFRYEKHGLEIKVPDALHQWGRRTYGERSWVTGSALCWHTFLVLSSCLTTRLFDRADEMEKTYQSMRGWMYCLAHYYEGWMGKLGSAAVHDSLRPHFQRMPYHPQAAPVCAGLFDDWAIPVAMGLSRRDDPVAVALQAAYDPHNVDKTRWAHPVWAFLHMVPVAGAMPLCVGDECKYFQALLVALTDLIPCNNCRMHKWDYCSKNALAAAPDGVLSDRDDDVAAFRAYLARWMWEFHDEVNKRTRAQVISFEDSQLIWNLQKGARTWNVPIA